MSNYWIVGAMGAAMKTNSKLSFAEDIGFSDGLMKSKSHRLPSVIKFSQETEQAHGEFKR